MHSVEETNVIFSVHCYVHSVRSEDDAVYLTVLLVLLDRLLFCIRNAGRLFSEDGKTFIV